MEGDVTWLPDLARALARARWIILTPALIGVGLFLVLGGAQGALTPVNLICLAIGLTGASVAGWVLRIGIDSAFLPALAETRGLTHEPVASHPYRLLPEGILPEGNTRMMRNVVSGDLEGRRWQAGFLEITRKQQNGNREIKVFSGQLVQVQAGEDIPDMVLLPAFRRPAAASGSFGTAGMAVMGEITILGKRWQIHAQVEIPSQTREDLERMLENLPPPPAGAKLSAVVRANGWWHLVYGNGHDLFRLGGLLALWQKPQDAAERVFGRLAWAEGIARVMRF